MKISSTSFASLFIFFLEDVTAMNITDGMNLPETVKKIVVKECLAKHSKWLGNRICDGPEYNNPECDFDGVYLNLLPFDLLHLRSD